MSIRPGQFHSVLPYDAQITLQTAAARSVQLREDPTRSAYDGRLAAETVVNRAIQAVKTKHPKFFRSEQ